MSSDKPGDPPTMADSFTIPLRPLIEKRDRPDTLPVEIAQINAQWGSFRDVSETELRAKIQEEKEKEGILEEEEEAEEKGEKPAGEVDSTERLEQLYKRRAEITQFALYARVFTLVNGNTDIGQSSTNGNHVRARFYISATLETRPPSGRNLHVGIPEASRASWIAQFRDGQSSPEARIRDHRHQSSFTGMEVAEL